MPMFSAGVNVMDICVHTQDVRRGLGLDGELDLVEREAQVIDGHLGHATLSPKSTKRQVGHAAPAELGDPL